MMIRFRRALPVVLVAICLTGFAVAVAAADWLVNFEFALGQDSEPIGGSIPGLVFSTTSGDDLYFADINTGYYSVTSDNGKVYEDGSYFVSGDVAAYAANYPDNGKVSFVYGPASRFSIGYTSEFGFYLEAYDSSGTLIASDTGPANTKGQGGTGLLYLSVDTGLPNISYVLFHDEGGYWMIDNITTDAIVPEPSSILLGLATGLAGLMRLRRKGNSSI